MAERRAKKKWGYEKVCSREEGAGQSPWAQSVWETSGRKCSHARWQIKKGLSFFWGGGEDKKALTVEHKNLQENSIGFGNHFSLVLAPNSEPSSRQFIKENTKLMIEINRKTCFSLQKYSLVYLLEHTYFILNSRLLF